MKANYIKKVRGQLHNIKASFQKNMWNMKWKEVRKPGSGRTFYVIRRGQADVGLFSYVTVALGHIHYALKIDAIPIIDMQNYANTYLCPENIHKENAWEYFFQQPMEYSLNDISKNDSVILSYGGPLEFTPNTRSIYDNNAFRYWQQLYRKYVRLTPECLVYLENEKRKIFPPDIAMDQVLGVELRGTDYITTRPLHHPIQPSPEEAFPVIRNMMQKYHLHWIYLETEDDNIYKKMMGEFGELIIAPNSFRYCASDNKIITKVLQENNENRRENGLLYLRDTYLLSCCRYLVSGLNGGSLAACLINDYRDKYIFNLGYYGE